jgi:hypothetical protein
MSVVPCIFITMKATPFSWISASRNVDETNETLNSVYDESAQYQDKGEKKGAN